MENPEQLNLILEEENEKEAKPRWSLDEVQVQILSIKKILALSSLLNEFRVHVQPSNPPKNCIVLPYSIFWARIPIPLPRSLWKILHNLNISPG